MSREPSRQPVLHATWPDVSIDHRAAFVLRCHRTMYTRYVHDLVPRERRRRRPYSAPQSRPFVFFRADRHCFCRQKKPPSARCTCRDQCVSCECREWPTETQQPRTLVKRQTESFETDFYGHRFSEHICFSFSSLFLLLQAACVSSRRCLWSVRAHVDVSYCIVSLLG